MAVRKILGIDPGSRCTGYAVLTEENRKVRPVVYDVIRTAGLPDQTARLRCIYEELMVVIRDYRPDSCAVETPVYGTDPLAMLKLGRAQAAAMLAIANSNLGVTEYYPKAVKKAVTGNGNASKKQVAWMLAKLMELPDEPVSADASDAMAVAWCHLGSLDRKPAGAKGKKSHQNNRKSGWKAFIEDNPDRVRS